jgi:hypothetical protein
MAHILKNILKSYINLNPLIIFSPYLILFIFIVLRYSSDQWGGDEARYYAFAKNLLMGFYSPPPPNINLWNGPGYPLFLIPFVWFDLPLIIIKLTNAILQYLSIILLFYAIKKYTSRNIAFFFSIFWASYYISYQELFLIMTEPLTSFLSSLIVYLVVCESQSDTPKWKYSILLALTIGFLTLTKIIFGYVLISLIIIYFISNFNKRSKSRYKVTFILFLAMLLNGPYLIYTYNLTGKPFYWGNSGGNSLYWMSTPIEGEFGEWNNNEFTANCGHDNKIPCNTDNFSVHHKEEIESILRLPVIEQDDAFKKIAINNIINNPVKYLRNIVSNVSRLFFGIPNSYFYQREQTIWRILPNSIILSFFIFSLIITVVNYRLIPSEIRLIVGLTMFYLIFSSLVSAYPRQFYVAVPLMFFWFAYILDKSVRFRLQFMNKL